MSLAIALCAVSPRAQDVLTLKANLYDHDYGDFGGEFSATNAIGCSIDSHRIVPGMVQDSLTVDSVLHKKIPRRGSVDLCSQQIEKWFDPTQSRTAACGNLFLKNIGTADKPDWKFDDTAFFMMDDYSAQRTWTAPSLNHDYAYCMEINSSVDYRGGETLKFRGDDDVWVYVDNRLAVDLGGIHFAEQIGTARLDSLPYLRGKQGQSIDVDIYYCARQPGTSVFGMETNAPLSPLPVRSIEITDTLGNPMTSKDIVVGKTRVCARPYFQLPGEEICGNYKMPDGLSFLSAVWDLNGTQLSADGGQACLDLDPAAFANNTRIDLTAKAMDKSSRISLTLIRLAKPLQGRLTGDGRAEGVEIDLDPNGGPAPDGLETQFDFAGLHRYLWVLPDSAKAWSMAGKLGDDYAGPAGVTGFAPVTASARQTVYGHVSDRQVELRDGVRPVLGGAWFRWGAMNGKPAYLDVQASEPLGGHIDSLAAMLTLARAGGGAPSLAASGAGVVSVAQDNHYYLPLSPSLADSLQSGDSLSLSSFAADEAGNAARYHPVAISFPRNVEVTSGDMRFQANPARGPAFLPVPASALIPVSAAGEPLLDRDPDRNLAAARGPVVVIPARAALDRLQLRFYDQFGTFINEVDHAMTAEEWDAVKAASPGDTTWARYMWYPVSRAGARLGTGAYVAQGRLWVKPGATATGPNGEPVQVKGGSVALGPIRFGYIRD